MIQGVIAGNFDIIHPGYIKMFKECKQNCDNFIILLQTDPTIERPEKLKPILSIQERIETLNSIKYIDMVVKYTTESDLIGLLKFLKPNIRFLGDDYKGKPYSGDDLGIPIHYINRSHGWSTTKFKQMIADTL
tara:strand:- start:72 stop:470 length:399 start_codon:yes stop_codon:yes gene_type:complete